jgi:hypothetical protein
MPTNKYRSKFEERVGRDLDSRLISFTYESMKIKFTQPAQERTYTPDMILPNGIVIELKGLFIAADRKKHLLVQEQHPEIDLRFVFQNPNTRLSKDSRTTYAMWCEKHGFKYAAKTIPDEWVNERGCL